jgi:hypothetical protein
MKIFLDDTRVTPHGFVRTFTAEETIELIYKNNGKIQCISLDNDLGSNYKEGKEVLKWIKEKAYYNELLPIPRIIIHSANPVAQEEMITARFNSYKFWAEHGYDVF